MQKKKKNRNHIALLVLFLTIITLAPIAYKTYVVDAPTNKAIEQWDESKYLFQTGENKDGPYETEYTPLSNPEKTTTIRAKIRFYLDPSKNNTSTAEMVFDCENAVKRITTTKESLRDSASNKSKLFESVQTLTIDLSESLLESNKVSGKISYTSSKVKGISVFKQNGKEEAYTYTKDNSAKMDFSTRFNRTITLYDGKKNPVANIRFFRESLVLPENNKSYSCNPTQAKN